MVLKSFRGRATAVVILACAVLASPAQTRPSLRFADDLVATAREARQRGVPILIAVDYEGRAPADAVVGLPTDDFYRLYLEQAIDAGNVALREAATP